MHSNKNEQTLSVLFMEKSFDLLIAMKWNLKRQGNNPYRSTNQMLESREWLVKKRDKHEVMRAINSCTFNAPSSNKQTFIHETELRSFERVIGKFFFLFFYVFRKELQFISRATRNYSDLIEILTSSQSRSLSEVWVRSNALTM